MSYNLNQIHTIVISQLLLDPLNPRLPERLLNSDEVEVLNWMLTDSTLTDLMGSIVENGFFTGEPLIGIQSNEIPNTIIIVEGNRRLASIKILLNPGIAEHKIRTVIDLSNEAGQLNHIPTHLPIYIVANRDEVANYLGFRHVSGVKQWPVIAKARYLSSLFESREWRSDIYRVLAKEIGSKSVYVRRLIVGYQLYKVIENNNFYDLDELTEENFDLSLVTDAATKYGEIASFMSIQPDERNSLRNLNQENFRLVFNWLYKRNESSETIVGESRNLPILNKILSSEIAKEAFINQNYSFSDAAALTTLADENVRWFLQNARTSMLEAQKLIHTIQAPNRTDIRVASEIRDSAETIRNAISTKLIANDQTV